MGHSLLDLMEIQNIFKKEEYNLENEEFDLIPMIANYQGQTFFSLIEEYEDLFDRVSAYASSMDQRVSLHIEKDMLKRLLQYTLRQPTRFLTFKDNQEEMLDEYYESKTTKARKRQESLRKYAEITNLYEKCESLMYGHYCTIGPRCLDKGNHITTEYTLRILLLSNENQLKTLINHIGDFNWYFREISMERVQYLDACFEQNHICALVKNGTTHRRGYISAPSNSFTLNKEQLFDTVYKE